MNPRQYIKRYEEIEKEKRKRLNIVEKQNQTLPKSGGRKTKKQRDLEDRMKDQKDFLLFLDKNKKLKPPDDDDDDDE